MALSEAEELELLELENENARAQSSTKPIDENNSSFVGNISQSLKNIAGYHVGQGNTPVINPSPRTFPQLANTLTQFATPPLSPADILSKARFAEQAGGNIKNAGQEFINRAVGSPNLAWIPPVVKAGVGTAASLGMETAPFKPSEFASTAGTDIGLNALGGVSLSPTLRNFAQKQSAKALGYTKRFLNTSGKQALAKKTAQTMLEEKVVSPLATTQDMIDRVAELKTNTGNAIGEYLQSKGLGFDPVQAAQKLESLKLPFKGGYYEKINGAIDEAIDTIKAHGNSPISWEEANDIKGILQSASKYNVGVSNPVNDINQDIAAQFRNYIDSGLEALSGNGQDFKNFLQNKRIYGATKSAEQALNNRFSSGKGNNSFSLTDWIMAAGGAGAGALQSPEKALYTLAAIGAKKGIEAYGHTSAASAANYLANMAGKIQSPAQGYLPVLASTVSPIIRRFPKHGTK